MGLTRIKVFLKNGTELLTVEEFEGDPVEAILDEIEDRDTGSFKQIGGLYVDFREIAGFAID